MMGKYILQILNFGIYDFFSDKYKPILNFTVIKNLLGKGKGVVNLLAIRLCGFPTALFTEYSQPCHARLAFRGMCQLEKDMKNADSRQTARKMGECTILGYSLLCGISLPKSLPICYLNGHR